jgi:hypothetical protein
LPATARVPQTTAMTAQRCRLDAATRREVRRRRRIGPYHPVELADDLLCAKAGADALESGVQMAGDVREVYAGDIEASDVPGG